MHYMCYFPNVVAFKSHMRGNAWAWISVFGTIDGLSRLLSKRTLSETDRASKVEIYEEIALNVFTFGPKIMSAAASGRSQIAIVRCYSVNSQS